jgi:hypothetical protein
LGEGLGQGNRLEKDGKEYGGEINKLEEEEVGSGKWDQGE